MAVKRKGNKEKKENEEIFLNVPNMLTLSRLGLTFVFVYMLFFNFYKNYLIIIFAIAALTDWFDGFFARRLNQKTKIGARMDQVIDRVFTITVVSAILLHSFTHNIFDNTLLLVLLICSREMISTPGILVAIIRNKDLYRVTFIGKLTTFVQGFALGAIILQLHWAIYLAIVTCVVGIIAGLDYLKYSMID